MEKASKLLKRLGVYHIYYRRSGFYRFAFNNAIKVAVILLTVFVLFVIIEKYIIDLETVFQHITANLPPLKVLSIFFISEIVLGLIPPDFFILWAQQMPQTFLYLCILSILSYTGGVIAFRIGCMIGNRPKMKAFFVKRVENNLHLIKRWGGILIVVAALFPLPFSTISFAGGILRYPFTRFLFFGLFRIPRFFIYAYFLDLII